MLMFCLRMRSSRRSSGPSYISATVTENGESVSAAGPPAPVMTARSSAIRFDRLCGRLEPLRHVHRGSHVGHGAFGGDGGALGAVLEDVPNELGIALVFPATLLHGIEQGDHVVRAPRFA